ncbi:MAG: LPS export ABC transporter permease LptF [Enterobacteriaceae bacterium]
MIIIRYLVRETLKSQMAILFILLLIFFCQKLVKILEKAVEGDIPTSLILPLLGLGIPTMAQLILPLSLFLALLMTYSKLYMESEMTVMAACGFGPQGLLKAAGVLACFTAVLATVNSLWLSPWSMVQYEKMIAQAKANPSVTALAEGQFQTSRDGNYVLFIGDVKQNKFKNVFVAQLRPTERQRPSVVVAERGKMIRHEDGSQSVWLDKGTRYEGTALLRDFRITNFTDYQANMDYRSVEARDSDDVDQASVHQLLRAKDVESRAELHWRLTLICSVFLMAIMVVPLSKVNPRQGRTLSILPAILLYLVYFLLQSSFKTNGSRGKLDPALWIWLTNGGYLLLAILVNAWDSSVMRRLRARLTGAV